MIEYPRSDQLRCDICGGHHEAGSGLFECNPIPRGTGVTFIKAGEESKVSPRRVIIPERLWLDDSRDKVVLEGDPRARQLLIRAGGNIDMEVARSFNLVDEEGNYVGPSSSSNIGKKEITVKNPPAVTTRTNKEGDKNEKEKPSNRTVEVPSSFDVLPDNIAGALLDAGYTPESITVATDLEIISKAKGVGPNNVVAVRKHFPYLGEENIPSDEVIEEPEEDEESEE